MMQMEMDRGVSLCQPSLLSCSPENPKQTDTPTPAWGVCSGSVWVTESLMKPHCADQGPNKQPQPCPRGLQRPGPAAGSELGGAKAAAASAQLEAARQWRGPWHLFGEPSLCQEPDGHQAEDPTASGPAPPIPPQTSAGEGVDWRPRSPLVPPTTERKPQADGCSLLPFC